MTWYCRSRAVVWIGVALAGSVVLAVVASGTAIPLPNLVSVLFVPVALSLLAPLAPVVVLAYGFARSRTSLEWTAVRTIPGYDLVVLAVMITAATVIALVVGQERWPLAHAYLRNLVGFAGLLLVAASVLGFRLAGLVPVAAVLGSALFGTAPDRTARWWAWPIAAADSVPASCCAGAAMVLGVAATFVSTREIRLGRAGIW